MTSYFIQAFIYLCAAVVAVPVAKRLGLGSVLGYLIAGVIIGPVTGLVGSETTTIQHFAEFGVVMMLFLVGLELEPRMLWDMRHRLIGLGGFQVTLTAALVTGLCLLTSMQWQFAVATGLLLSLSSTAIVLQTFNEKGLNKTEGGKGAFAVLLFQDIAVIPMLAFIPLLAMPELVPDMLALVADSGHDDMNLLVHLPGWAHPLVILGAIAVVVIGGHYLSRPLFRIIASTGLREMFTAAALMIVIGIAALMSLVGLSPALGTFLAGVVMANSEFRHELEADIEPFKGLLLGLFFITVGAGVDFTVISDNLLTVVSATAAIMLLKAFVLLCLARLFQIRRNDGWLLTLSLAQAGEFGFVLLSFCVQNYVLPIELAQIISPVIALSMFLTPALFIVFDRVVMGFYEVSHTEDPTDTIDDEAPVIIAGIGRYGQIVNRMLIANNIKTIVLDHDAAIINNVSQINIKSYYGDASRPDLLHTAGIETARLVVIAIDDRQRTTDMVKYLHHHYPTLKILARAYDRTHCYELDDAGATHALSETYKSALATGTEALKQLGIHPFRAEILKQTFCSTEDNNHHQMKKTWIAAREKNKTDTGYIELFIALEEALAERMKRGTLHGHDDSERSWAPPPKHYQDDPAFSPRHSEENKSD